MPRQFGAAARKLRLQAHNTVRAQLTTLSAVLLDPDLSPEAKRRRTQPLRTELRQTFETSALALGKIRDEARRAYIGLLPVTLRRVAAFKDPARAAAMGALLAQLPASELREIAELAIAENDGAAAYAVVAVATRGQLDDPDIKTTLELAESWKGAERAEARADFIVAHAELERVATDIDEAIGVRTEPLAMLNRANMIGLLPNVPGAVAPVDDHERRAAYEAIGETYMLENPAVLPEPARAAADLAVITDPYTALAGANAE